jgi:hypothetical protein
MADRHKLEIRGYGELLAEFCELADRVAASEVEVAALRQEVAQLRAAITEPPTWRPAATEGSAYDIRPGALLLRETDGD